MSEAKAIRKHSAQHDLFNRLHSVASDVRFVRTVATDWYGGRFDVVANQRCGTWYCDPSSSSTAYAYFKSTDGHTNNWNFNLRRSNLPFAQYAEDRGGVILVDSTRRGKRMPDALSKTVPIWCAVINLAISLRRSKASETSEHGPDEWDTTLYLPPNIVSPSEQSQITSRLQAWAEALEGSSLPLPTLQKPLRPFFLHPSTSVPPAIPSDPPFTPILCLSASRWVGKGSMDEIPSVTRVAGGTVGFEYVQGAGDDDELWGRGLKPGLFHSNKEQLLSVDRDDLPDLVDELVTEAKADAFTHAVGGMSLATGDSECIPETSATTSSLIGSYLSDHHPTGVPGPSSRLALAIGPPISPSAWLFPTSPSCSAIHYVRVVPIDKPSKHETPQWILTLTQDTSVFVCPLAKSDLKGYTHSVAALVDHVRRLVRDRSSSVMLCPGGKADLETAKRQQQQQQLDPAKSPATLPETTHQPLPPADVDSRKLILPLALALILAIPSISQPDLQPDSESESESDSDEMPETTKAEIADVLHGLVSLWPDGNPPRAAVKRVNQYLMSEGWE